MSVCNQNRLILSFLSGHPLELVTGELADVHVSAGLSNNLNVALLRLTEGEIQFSGELQSQTGWLNWAYLINWLRGEDNST